MAILELTVSPRKKGEESLRESVAIAEEVIRSSGLTSMLTPMSTIIEGDLNKLLRIVEMVNKALIDAGHYRVYTVAKIDYRVDKEVKMMDKVEAVERVIVERKSR